MDDYSKAVSDFVLQALLIGMINFIFPLWVATGINWGALLVKVFEWFSLDIVFWEKEAFLGLIILIMLAPLVYILWFYFLTVKKLCLRFYQTILQPILREIANFISQLIVDWYDGHPEGLKEDNVLFLVEKVLNWIDTKVENWPYIPRWVAKKILAQIPFVDLIMEYHDASFTAEDHQRLSAGLFQRMNKIAEAAIEEIIPPEVKWIIPVNLFLLFTLWFS